MHRFEKLRVLRAFRTQNADIFDTLEALHLLGEIGLHQARGEPLSLKQLFLLDIGSIATIQRRLRRLKELGIVKHRQAPGDHRSVELTLSPRCIRVFAQYDALMSSKQPAPEAVKRGSEPRHLCGLCDSDAGRRNLLTAFLAQGLKRGDKCILVAPAAVQREIVDALPYRRRATEQLVLAQGHDSVDGQLAFYKDLAREARRAGQKTCLATVMSWVLACNLQVDAMLDYERRLDVAARRQSMRALCVYDAREFSGSDFLHAMKCHGDHARHPIMLG